MRKHILLFLFIIQLTPFVLAQNYASFDSLYLRGQFVEAKQLFLANNYLKSSQNDSSFYYHYYRFIHINTLLGQFKVSDSLLNLTQKTIDEQYPKPHFLYGIASFTKASIDFRKNKVKEALERYEIAIELCQNSPFDFANAISGKAGVSAILGQNVEAEKSLSQVLKILTDNNLTKVALYARTLQSFGTTNMIGGNYEKAENYYKEALVINEQLFGKESLGTAQTALTMGNLYFITGRYEKAEAILKTVIPLFEKNVGKNHPQYAIALSFLARTYYLNKQYEKAEPLLLEATALSEKVIGKQSPDYATMLGALGNLYIFQKRYVESEKYFDLAKEIQATYVGKNHMNYLITLGNLSQVYSQTGKFDKSIETLTDILTNGKDILGEQSDRFMNFQYALAKSYLYKGDYENSFTNYKKANTLLINHLKRNFNYLSEEDRLAFYESFEENIESFNNLAVAYPKPEVLEELANLRLFTKGILLNESRWVQNSILNSNDMVLKDLYGVFLQLKKQLSKAYTLGTEQLKQHKIDISALEAKADNIEQQLVQSSSIFSTWRNNSQEQANVLFSRLKSDEIALEIIRYKPRVLDNQSEKTYYNFLIISNKNNKIDYQLLTVKDGKSLENLHYESYYLEMTRHTGNQSLLNEVSHIFIDKLLPFFENVNTIFCSTDGIFNKINLNTFLNKKGEYLRDKHNFVFLTNLHEIAIDSTRSTAKNAVLIGNPVYDLKKSKLYDIPDEWKDVSLRSFELKPNLYTQKEVKTIQKILNKNGWQSSLWIKKDAKEDSIKRLTFSPNILHIASHGYYIEKQNSSNITVLKNKNPLLRSMLFLAGAQNTLNNEDIGEEDGILSAYEMSNLNLTATELVVLSACHTGLGNIKNGEGVYGLQRAVKTAGAKALIISLWEVDDRATQELMSHFYDFWLKGDTKTEALRKAQRKVQEIFPQPFYWGGFILVGR